MGGGRISYLIYGLKCGINGGIEADGVVGAGDIVINSGRDANGGYPPDSIQLACSPEGTIPSDDDYPLQAEFLYLLAGFFLSALPPEFRGAGRFQDSSAPIDNIAELC